MTLLNSAFSSTKTKRNFSITQRVCAISATVFSVQVFWSTSLPAKTLPMRKESIEANHARVFSNVQANLSINLINEETYTSVFNSLISETLSEETKNWDDSEIEALNKLRQLNLPLDKLEMLDSLSKDEFLKYVNDDPSLKELSKEIDLSADGRKVFGTALLISHLWNIATSFGTGVRNDAIQRTSFIPMRALFGALWQGKYTEVGLLLRRAFPNARAFGDSVERGSRYACHTATFQTGSRHNRCSRLANFIGNLFSNFFRRSE